MSDAQYAYTQYVSKFGNPPKQAHHLISFGKQIGININWKQAKTILTNPPTANSSQNANTPIPNTQQFTRSFTRKRNNANIGHRSSSKSDAIINAFNLKVKMDPNTGKQYVSSQGIPPPPSSPDTSPQPISPQISPNTQQKRISSRGIPPPPGSHDVFVQQTAKKQNNNKRVSSRGVPPPPGHIDIWRQPQHQHTNYKNSYHHNNNNTKNNRYQAYTASPKSMSPQSSPIPPPKSPVLTTHYRSHESYKSMTAPQLHSMQYAYSQQQKHSNSMRQFPYSPHQQQQQQQQQHNHKSHSMTQFQLQLNQIYQVPAKKQQSSATSEYEIDSLMKQMDRTSKQIKMINNIIPNLYEAQQNCHKLMSELGDQCISTYIPPAVLGDQFSDPDDQFAEFLRCMGRELKSLESIENDYLDTMQNKLVKPMEMLNNGGFNKVFRYYSNYKNKSNECKNNKNNESLFFETSLLKLKLQKEMAVVQSNVYCELVNDAELYWKSYRKLAKSQWKIMSQSKMRTESINAWNSDDEKEEHYFSDAEEQEFEVKFDIESIDEEVGFNNIYLDIIKYKVKLGKNKQYKRVIYVDRSNKQIKLLTLKTEIMQYGFSDIEKVEKEYNVSDMNRLCLRFKDNKEYFYEFETATKREQFAAQLLDVKGGDDTLLSIFVGSWNVGESEFDVYTIPEWLPNHLSGKHDLYIIGLQEVKAKLKNKWINGILTWIDNGKGDYIILNKTFLMAIGIIMIIHRMHASKISHLQFQTVATGKGNIIGNKGATAISFQYMESTFLFVNCHLAARAERFEKRAENITRIIKELNIGIINDIDVLHQFSHIVWFGDLNYRVEKDWNSVLKMVEDKNWSECLKYDQLYHQMKFETVFSGFNEGQIDFCPTYRWDRRDNIVSNKREQPPSYTDRILYRTLPNSFNLWQQTYTSSPNCYGSDHRPIYSIFKVKPRIPYFSYSVKRKYSKIVIRFSEIKVNFTNNDIINMIDTKYPMDIKFYYLYSSPNQYLAKNGHFIQTHRYWEWRSLELDILNIKPFINDPSFIAMTHIFCSFVQKDNILGHCTISLFDTFPSTLLNTDKIKNDYFNTNGHIQTMYEVNEYQGKKICINNRNGGNSKSFNIKISQNGIIIGNIEGYLCVDGKLIRKHIRYSTMASSHVAISRNDDKKEYSYNDNKDDIDDHMDDIKEIEPNNDNNNNISEQWSCQYCTFLNINNKTKVCQVCGGEKDQFIYAAQLQQLKEMGFNNEQKIKSELMAQAGNVERAAHCLLLLNQ